MTKIKVLIVDDAVVVRRIVTDVLSKDPMIEIIGAAANGRIALAKIEQVKPDVITMDVEMPEMDGLETLKELRKIHPKLPVIMFSTLTERGGMATLEALSLGASDYVTKPANVGSVPLAMKRIEEELIPKIKALCPHIAPQAVPRRISSPASATALNKSAPNGLRPARNAPAQILAIGVSTGGPNALADLLPALPRDFPIPVVIVQHMPSVFTRLLAERLQTKCSLRVRECIAGEALRPGDVWIAPGGLHMYLEREGTSVRLRTNQDPPENSCRPAVDVLFRSVARVYGGGALAVILTGMGQDGLRGCEPIYDAGGRILAQDEATSVVWGMPGVVAHAGLADKILPLQEMGSEILRLAQKKSPLLSTPTPSINSNLVRN